MYKSELKNEIGTLSQSNHLYLGHVISYKELMILIDNLDDTPTTEQAWKKIAEKYDKSIANVEADFEDWINSGSTQTKEKQKIPQFVAKEIPSAPKEALDRYYNPGVYIVPPYSYKVINWIEGHFDIFLQALVNGYTEKAPVWIVKAPYDRYFGGFLEKGQHTEINFSHINKDNAQKFEDKEKAEAAATLVDGEVEEWSE